MGHVETHVAKGIPKVQDKQVTLNIVTYDGNKHVIKAMVGEPLLYALKKNFVPINHACNGGDLNVPSTEFPLDTTSWGPACSECQVIVSEPWLKYLKPMGENEQARLARTTNSYFGAQSRLACCVMVEKWMDGMQLGVPYNDDSRPVGGDAPFEQGENRIHRF